MKLTEKRSKKDVKFLVNNTKHIEVFKDMHDEGKIELHAICCKYMKYEFFDQG